MLLTRFLPLLYSLRGVRFLVRFITLLLEVRGFPRFFDTRRFVTPLLEVRHFARFLVKVDLFVV